VETIWQLEGWAAEAGIRKPSIYNFAVTDGQNIATIRYVSDPKIEPISLYFSKRRKNRCSHKRSEIITDCCLEVGGIVVSSERLISQCGTWMPVAPNHVVTIDGELNVKVRLVTDF